RQPDRSSLRVAQRQHPDAPGLAVALRQEPHRASGCGGLAQLPADRLELRHRTVPEEGQRDVQVVAGDRPAPVDVVGLPVGQRVERLLGETESTEQARTLTAVHASRELHAASSRVCCKRRLSRCRAVTVARRRIDSRSPGKTKSAPCDRAGVCAWRYTSPTGFSALPPPGPAIPVTETETSAPSRALAPAAIASAASAETAPRDLRRSGGTSSSRILTSSEYATTTPRKMSLEPETHVSRCET